MRCIYYALREFLWPAPTRATPETWVTSDRWRVSRKAFEAALTEWLLHGGGGSG